MARKDNGGSCSEILKNIGSGMIIIDRQFNVLYSNDLARSMIGDVTGKHCYSFNPASNNRPCAGCPCIEIFEGKKLAKKSLHVLDCDDCADGKTWLEVVATPVKDNEGAIVGAVETIYDITALKKAGDELEKTKNYLQHVLDASPEMMVSLDKKGFVTGWNKAAERITGCRQSEMVGKNLFIPIEGLGEMSKMLMRSLSETEPGFHEISITTKDSVDKSLVCSTSVIKDADDLADGGFMMAKNVISRQRTHKDLVGGATYIVPEKDKAKAMEAFNNLLERGYRGVFITRDDPASFKGNPDTEVLWLTSRESRDFPTASEGDQILSWLDKRITNRGKSAVFLDRADSVTLHGFENLLKIIYTINDNVVQTENIALISVNPAAFNDQQLNMIKQELKSPPFSDQVKVSLSKRQLDLLRMMHNKNMYFRKVYFKDINKEFSISKITTNKLVTSLEDIGLLMVKKVGRVKVVELTDKGKGILSSEPSV